MSPTDGGELTVRTATRRDLHAPPGTVAIVTAAGVDGTVIEFGLDRRAVEELIRFLAETRDVPRRDTSEDGSPPRGAPRH